MSFTKSKIKVNYAPAVPVMVVKESVEEHQREDGSIVIEHHFDEVDACDPSNFPELPTVEEYSLTNLINSNNVDALQQIPISGLVSSDASDIDSINSVTEALKKASETSKTE